MLDLRERYARVAIQASAPIVPFRESLVLKNEVNPQEKVGQEEKGLTVKVKAYPLPKKIVNFLNNNSQHLKSLFSASKAINTEDTEVLDLNDKESDMEAFIKEFEELLSECPPPPKCQENFWPNILNK